MTAAVAAQLPQGPAQGSAVARKLRVMARLHVDNDRTWNGRNSKTNEPISYSYMSIQAVSEHVRTICAEEGLDVQVRPWPDPQEHLAMVMDVVEKMTTAGLSGAERTDPSSPPGLVERLINQLPAPGTWMQVTLVNTADPRDVIVARWRIVEGDKAWAYSTKYALIRMLLIGDAAEPDEDAMAAASAAAPTQRPYTAPQRQQQGTPPRTGVQPPRPATPPQQRPAADSRPQGDCPECSAKGVRGTVLRAANPPDPDHAYFCAGSRRGCGKFLAEPVRPAPADAPQTQAAEPPAKPESAGPAQPPAQGPGSGNIVPLGGAAPRRELDLTEEQKDNLRERYKVLKADGRHPSRERFQELCEAGYEAAVRAFEVMRRAASLPEAVRPTAQEVDKAVQAGLDEAEAWVAGLAADGTAQS